HGQAAASATRFHDARKRFAGGARDFFEATRSDHGVAELVGEDDDGGLAGDANGHRGDVARCTSHDAEKAGVDFVMTDRAEVEALLHGEIEDASGLERNQEVLHAGAITELRRAGPSEVASALDD